MSCGPSQAQPLLAGLCCAFSPSRDCFTPAPRAPSFITSGPQCLCHRPAGWVTLDLPKSPLTGTEALLTVRYGQSAQNLSWASARASRAVGCNQVAGNTGQMGRGPPPAPAGAVALRPATWAPPLLDGRTADETGGNLCRVLVSFAFLLFQEKLNIFS